MVTLDGGRQFHGGPEFGRREGAPVSASMALTEKPTVRVGIRSDRHLAGVKIAIVEVCPTENRPPGRQATAISYETEIQTRTNQFSIIAL